MFIITPCRLPRPTDVPHLRRRVAVDGLWPFYGDHRISVVRPENVAPSLDRTRCCLIKTALCWLAPLYVFVCFAHGRTRLTAGRSITAARLDCRPLFGRYGSADVTE